MPRIFVSITLTVIAVLMVSTGDGIATSIIQAEQSPAASAATDQPTTPADPSQSQSQSQMSEDDAAAEAESDADAGRFWSFRHLHSAPVPEVRHGEFIRTPVDNFIEAMLEQHALTMNPPTDKVTLLRRLTFDLTGIPPTIAEIDAFLADESTEATQHVVDRLLDSPMYGERWGKFWLDVAGYADSNGYFNADSDRPLAYHYRDYVIRAFNADKPFDQFVREQLAGDEMARLESDQITERTRELLTATHFLRNAPDGTSESDGNPDERTVDRATVLEGAVQITINSLLGLTIQCARCHEHKFEPIPHEDYYRLQAVFYPAFPAFDAEQWVAPKSRNDIVASEVELAQWKSENDRIDGNIRQLRAEFATWVRANRPQGSELFADAFDDGSAALAKRWSNTVPGDDTPAGTPAVNVGSGDAPGAAVADGTLQIIEGGGGDRWLTTRQVFDWTPDETGASIQATFDLIDDKLPSSAPAARIGYCIALHDFDKSSGKTGGNILIDGNPAGATAVHIDYPGDGSTTPGQIGTTGYRPGHTFGVRVTNVGDGKFELQHIADWQPEGTPLTLSAADLPDGAFGFEYCCERSFVVDNIVIERLSATADSAPADAASADGTGAFAEQYRQAGEKLEQQVQALDSQRPEQPGRLSFVRDLLTPAPDVFLLERGSYGSRGVKVLPAGLEILSDGPATLDLIPLSGDTPSNGHRLAFARWLTAENSRPAALLARVIVNRVWQQHFGVGLVNTPDNFGYSGNSPSHPELLEYLAFQLVESGWRIKKLHRLLLNSHVYQQSSRPYAAANDFDPENRLLRYFPIRRLDAEAIRDSMLSISGELDPRMFGPYVPTKRLGDGNVVVEENRNDAYRRGIYLQQRRSQVNTFLQLFDAPSIVTTCSDRSTSTVPLQSLALLNSEFARKRAEMFHQRAEREAGSTREARLEYAFRLIAGRVPNSDEAAAVTDFLDRQQVAYGEAATAERQAWIDLCQMLLASNAFLYVE